MNEGSSYCGCGSEIDGVSVGCGDDREYGHERRWRWMKYVKRKTVSSQIRRRFLTDRLGITGFVEGREGRGVDYFRGLLRETVKKEFSFRGLRVR